MHPRLPRLRNLLLTATALLALGVAPVAAGPEGGAVVGGAATIQGQGGPAVIVNQSSSSAIINWNTFNIRANESVRFNQPSNSSVALNRVTGGLGPSEIMGTLTANGRVFIINRDGVLFGPGAVVHTAGFLASTNDIRNSDFMAGRYNFNIPGRPDASIVNQGRITATSGGFAALVAPGVRNSGTITATLGTVALAAGNSFTLDMYGDKLITLAVNDQIASQVIDVATGKPLKSLVTNDGKIRANGGRVELTAAAARHVVDSVINTSGVIKANSIGHRNGMIVLSAATGGSKPAGAPAQTIKISGTLSAAGKRKDTKGGTILVTGEDIKFASALVDASGRAGGGKVLIGGDWGGGRPDASLVNNPSARLESFAIATATTVSVDPGTTINASATERGDGGKVVLWSDSQTTFAGTILARGGEQGGDGGFVETSSHGQLNYSGQVDTRAPRGKAGTLLLDPEDFFIRFACEVSCGPNETTATKIQSDLESNNVVIATNNNPLTEGNGDIFVNASINWNNDHSLTLNAFRNINIAANVAISNGTIANPAGGNLVLRADSTGTGVGTVTFASGTTPGQVNFTNSTGAVSIFYNPDPSQTPGQTKYQNPTNFLCATSFCGGVFAQPSQLTAYMLVNNAADLNDVRTNTAGTYALAQGRTTPLSVGSFPNFAPIPNFTGLFDGQGQTIANLTIAPNDPTTRNIGLFGTIGSAGIVRNLNLANVSVSANPGFNSSVVSQWVGTLAGTNAGEIINVSATGQVNGGNIVGVVAGGLVGQNGMLGANMQAGLITDAHANVAVTVGNGGPCPGSCNFNSAGGLVGANVAASLIADSSASGNVIAGDSAWAGGLVGNNGFFSVPGGTGDIVNSSASGNVFSGGVNVALGGLVGFNGPSSTITDSFATGNVTATAAVAQNGPDCSASNSCQFADAGGLVGQNAGIILGTTLPELALLATCGVGQACASGAVKVGSNGTGGGLVGFNNGIIENAFATGNVTGAAGGVGGQGGSTTLGGLVGNNQGLILEGYARGAVGNLNVANLQAGGLVGDNSGAIISSAAIGDVRAGSGSVAGGLVASNSPNSFNCNGCFGDGQAFLNAAVILNSSASGNVSVGAASVAGGFAGAGDGTIALSSASGAVTGGGNSVLGGFIGALSFENGLGFIYLSTASGPVTSTGPNSAVGGFVGLSGGTISDSSASGPVTGTSDSYLGGFAGVNLGLIDPSSATGSVTGSGSHNIVGGFVGANFGSIDSSSAAGNASSGAASTVGGFAGANARFVNFGPDSIPGSSFPVGTITNSTATGTASAGPGSRVDPFIAANDPTTASNPPAFPSIIAGCSDPTCVFLNTGVLPSPSSPTPPTPPPLPPFLPEFLQSLAAQQTQQILNLTNTVQLAALSPGPVVNIVQGGVGLPPQPSPPAPVNPNLPPGFDRRIVDIPPLGETRFTPDVIVVQIRTDVGVDRLGALVAGFGLTVEASENLAITGSTAVRLRITNGRPVAEVIQALATVQVAAVIQPEYVYILQQQSTDPAPASRGDPAQQGDAAQYILEKLKISDVHRIVRGTNVPIAVINSEIDTAHPDLEGVVAQRFSAFGAPEKPHPHGTGMAGAIASHQRLLGIAPAARLLAVHAFSSSAATAESTTFNILKGVDWAVKQGARVINMSFAGPKDPSFERALKLTYDKGIVLIAAAGNAGPKSPPLFPGADPNVIAVTATDIDDKLFTGANRGKYISVAAPGVDILVPAPEGNYQLTTGTSVAAAEVSGIVALLLERNPKLTPADIRRILTASARRLGPGECDDSFGSGLIDPLKALQLAEPRTATTTPPVPTLRQR